MEAIILAGGMGTRLRNAVPDVPKPMAPICGKPFLEILLTNLANKGFKKIVLSLGYKAEKIQTYFGNEFKGVSLDYVVEDRPLGTGGALRLGMTKCQASHVFVFNGDTFIDLEVEDMERLWNICLSPIIVARMVSDVGRYGRLSVSEGLVKAFDEKGRTGAGLINAGCYVFPRDQLIAYSPGSRFSLETDYLEKYVDKGERLYFFETKSIFIDIGVPEDFTLAQSLLQPYL